MTPKFATKKVKYQFLRDDAKKTRKIYLRFAALLGFWSALAIGYSIYSDMWAPPFVYALMVFCFVSLIGGIFQCNHDIKKYEALILQEIMQEPVHPATVGDFRRLSGPDQRMNLIRRISSCENEYLVKSKPNRDMDNQYDTCVVLDVVDGKYPGLTLIVK